jgi:hypothetical protein
MNNKSKKLVLVVIFIAFVFAAFAIGIVLGRTNNRNENFNGNSENIISDSKEDNMSDNIFNLITAWDKYLKADVQCADTEIEINFGALKLDEEFSVKMRDFGYSTQGPTEDNYGYTIPTVVDWDMDGVLDIVLSSANSRIMFLKGIAGDIYHIEYPQFIEAEFMGKTPKPSWLWWEPQGKEICVLWRTTPNVVDLPLDEDGDGVAEGDGLMDLVLIDHEGILSFYQRYRDRDGTLKLKEGKRIFKLNGFIWQVVNIPGGDAGKWGWRMVDWDCDGDLDVIMQGGQYEGSVYFMENISTTPGEYNFVNRGHVHPRVIRCHEVHVSTCDWNKDGIPDILCGDISGNVYYYLNDLSKN